MQTHRETRAELRESLRLTESALWQARADGRDFGLREAAQLKKIEQAKAQIEKLKRLRDESPGRCERLEAKIEKLKAQLDEVPAKAKTIGRRAVEALAANALGGEKNARARELIGKLNEGVELKKLWEEFVDLRS